MNRIKKLLLVAGFLAIGTSMALADGGLWNNWPIAGGASYCSSQNNGICTNTVPAGPALTGLETMPADTHAAQGAPPQQVLIPSAALANVMSVQTPIAAATIVVPQGTTSLNMLNASALATLTVTLPPNPVNGQKMHLFSQGGVTALTLNGGTVVNGITAMTALVGYEFVYQASNTTWYRVQ